MMSHIHPVSSRHSASLKPRRVTAGLPMRRPEVTKGRTRIVRHGVLVHRDVRFPEGRVGGLARDVLGDKSRRNRWLSVPPETTL